MPHLPSLARNLEALDELDLPPSVEIRLVGNSGVCYEDGAGKLSLSASDFDEVGDCVYRFLVPAGLHHPCQFIHVYFNGKELAQ